MPLLWLLIMTIGSLLPGRLITGSSVGSIFVFDKWIHAMAYFILVLLVGVSIRLGLKRAKKVFFAVCVGLLIYSLCIELMQEFLSSGRSFEILDLIANFIGILTAYLIILSVKKRKYYGS